MSGSWWRRRSLRVRLTAASTVLVAAGSVGAAALLAAYLRHSLLEAVDAAARQRAADVAALVASGSLPAGLPGADGESIVQVVDGSGRTLLNGSTTPAVDLSLTGVRPGTVASRRLATGDPDRTPYRVAAAEVDGRPGAVAYAAAPADDVGDTIMALAAGLAVGIPVTTALVGAGTWVLVGRALAPVERMRRQAGDISAAAGPVPARLAAPASADELARLAETLNDMLDRLDASVRRERRLLADTAHELRSPVAAALARAELAARARPPAPEAAALLDDVRRLARLVDDVLVLTRLSGRAADPGGPQETLDLDDVVLAEAPAARPRDGVRLDLSRVSAARVVGNRTLLERVVRNLLDNAVRHARSAVAVSLSDRDGTAELAVQDDGPGIPAADRATVFERFTRLDEARHRDAGGIGLGLAIVRDVVAAHHGTVTIEDAGPGARVVVRLRSAGTVPAGPQ